MIRSGKIIYKDRNLNTVFKEGICIINVGGGKSAKEINKK